MSRGITRDEYERSIDRVRGRRDRAFQIARISGIMFTVFAAVIVLIRIRGGVIHAIPIITFIVGFAVLTVFGIVLPVFFAYVMRESPWVILEFPLRLARKGVVTDDFLCELMIWCTRENRKTVGVFERRMKRITIPGMLGGVIAVLLAVVVLCL